MDFGKRLKELRQEKGLTQEELAKEFFTSRQNISSWENGKTYPNMTDLIHLSDFFGVSLDVFLKEDGKVQESLESQETRTTLKKVYRSLILLDLLFIFIMLFKSLGWLSFDIGGKIFFIVSASFMIYNIFLIRQVDRKFGLNFRYPWQFHLHK